MNGEGIVADIINENNLASNWRANDQDTTVNNSLESLSAPTLSKTQKEEIMDDLVARLEAQHTDETNDAVLDFISDMQDDGNYLT